jgi:hypothetical protein
MATLFNVQQEELLKFNMIADDGLTLKAFLHGVI